MDNFIILAEKAPAAGAEGGRGIGTFGAADLLAKGMGGTADKWPGVNFAAVIRNTSLKNGQKQSQHVTLSAAAKTCLPPTGIEAGPPACGEQTPLGAGCSV